jgi:hypothetical protein
VEAAGGQQHLAEPLAVAGDHALQAHAAGEAAAAEAAGEVAAPVAASAVEVASEAVEDEDRQQVLLATPTATVPVKQSAVSGERQC